MTYNILEGGTGRIDPLAEVIRLSRSDVVVVQEAWDAELFYKLAERVGMDCFLAEKPGNAQGAVGLLSRWRIKEAVNHGPLDGRLTRSAFHAVVTPPASLPTAASSFTPPPGTQDVERELRIVGLHLHPHELFSDEEIRLREIEAIFEIGKMFGGRGHVLAGDFNTSHPQQRVDLARLRAKSRERIAGQKDELPREVVRRVLERGYVDAHAIERGPEDFQTSFTTSRPAMRVDFIFVTADLAPRVESCAVFKPEIGRFASDHFPVVAEVRL